MQPVVFTRRTQAHDAATGAVVPVETSISGSAMGLSRRTGLQTFKVIEATDIVLFFVTQTFGDRVKPLDTCEWDSETFVVKQVDSLIIDGPDIFGRILIGK